MPASFPLSATQLLCLLVGAWLVVQPAGVIVESVLRARRRTLTRLAAVGRGGEADTDAGLNVRSSWASGPRLIGWLERLLVYVFVLSEDLTAVGFLIAAKGTFRLVGLDQSELRSEAEQVFIGSLLSFTLALVLSEAIRWLVFFGLTTTG